MCIVCELYNVNTRVPLSARVDVFLSRDIFIPESCRICNEHLTADGQLILAPLVTGFVFVRRRVPFHGNDAGRWIQALRTQVRREVPTRFDTIDAFSEEDFRVLTSVTKDQFTVLLPTCQPVLIDGTNRNIYTKDLLLFLCKMRHGLSDEFLRFMFSRSTRQNVSMTVSKVRQSLMANFVPLHLGLGALTREEYMQRHVTDFSNTLYNPEPEQRKAILVIDGTYIRIPKNSNFRVMRQSFCVHKIYYLVKPIMIVAPNGHILDVHGPYFSDSRNNDANILRDQLRDDIGGLRAWLRDGDIFLVDRGYRDALEVLRQMNINVKMPGFVLRDERGRRQGVTEDVNASRLVTKSRWIVEARNGHIKSIFKFFKDMIPAPHVGNIGDFFRIGCALINAFRPEVLMAGADSEYARLMLERSRMPNILMERVERERLHTHQGGRWVPLQHADLPGFPRLSLEYLRDFTFGTYQVKLAPGYVQDRIERDREMRLEVIMHEPGLLRAKVYSRHTNAAKYQLWVQFQDEDVEDDDQLPRPFEEPIRGWYCRCKQGARTLGCCAHIASIIWYLGYARHEQNMRYPSNDLLRQIQDAGNRDLPDIIDPHGYAEEVGMEPPGERPEDRL